MKSAKTYIKKIHVSASGVTQDVALRQCSAIPLGAINWVVGDNGTGKSMFIATFSETVKLKKQWFDNALTPVGLKLKLDIADAFRGVKINRFYVPIGSFRDKAAITIDSALDIQMVWRSCGQKTQLMWDAIFGKIKEIKGELLLMVDDIELGLSPKSQIKTAQQLKNILGSMDIQFVGVCHSMEMIRIVGGNVIDFDDKCIVKTVQEYLARVQR